MEINHFIFLLFSCMLKNESFQDNGLDRKSISRLISCDNNAVRTCYKNKFLAKETGNSTHVYSAASHYLIEFSFVQPILCSASSKWKFFLWFFLCYFLSLFPWFISICDSVYIFMKASHTKWMHLIKFICKLEQWFEIWFYNFH